MIWFDRVHNLEYQILAVIKLRGVLAMWKMHGQVSAHSCLIRAAIAGVLLWLGLEGIRKHLRTINSMLILRHRRRVTWKRVEISWLIDQLLLMEAIIQQSLVLIENVLRVLLGVRWWSETELVLSRLGHHLLLHALTKIHDDIILRCGALIVFVRDSSNSMRSMMIIFGTTTIVVVVLVPVIVFVRVSMTCCLLMSLRTKLKVSVSWLKTLRVDSLDHGLWIELKVKWSLLLREKVLNASKSRLQLRICSYGEGLTVLSAILSSKNLVSTWEGRQALEMVGQIWSAWWWHCHPWNDWIWCWLCWSAQGLLMIVRIWPKRLKSAVRVLLA